MRVGLFSDTYHPTINGITFVVETLKTQLEAEGHEVFIFCPARTIRPKKNPELALENDNIIRIPSFRSGFFDDFDFALLFPPVFLRQIREIDLDIIHIFTPSQIGLLGINAAVKYDVPFVVQHSTDLYEYIEDYPNVLPGVLALVGVLFPMSVKLDRRDWIEVAKLQRPRLGLTKWGQKIIEKALTIVYSKADAVIALSRKSRDQLISWQDAEYNYEVTMFPSGVDAIPKPKKAELDAFRTQHGINKTDEVFGYVGRLGEEKNLDVLIKAFDKICKSRPKAKLVFVGDFAYRQVLEQLAAESRCPDRIVFTGFIQRQQLGAAYAVLDVFVFPSLKDTQGWVLHEAAHAKKPIVLIDRELTEVVVDGENGYFARNNATDVARKTTALLRSPALRAQFGARSKQLALRYTEKKQIKKILRLYENMISQHECTLKKRRRLNLSKFRRLLRRELGRTTRD